MAERLKAHVLKTCLGHTNVGSNPTPSAHHHPVVTISVVYGKSDYTCLIFELLTCTARTPSWRTVPGGASVAMAYGARESGNSWQIVQAQVSRGNMDALSHSDDDFARGVCIFFMPKRFSSLA